MSGTREQRRALALLLCAAALTLAPVMSAETRADSSYRLVAYIGGGYSHYSTAPGGPPPGVPVDYARYGFTGTARVMWYPDHLIRVGLETGWTTFYSYQFGIQDEGHMFLSGVPLFLVWSMNVLHVDLFAGAGYYYLNSRLDFHGSVNGDVWTPGWMAAGSYTHKISDNLGIAGEIKWLNAVENQDATIAFQVLLVWKILEW